MVVIRAILNSNKYLKSAGISFLLMFRRFRYFLKTFPASTGHSEMEGFLFRELTVLFFSRKKPRGVSSQQIGKEANKALTRDIDRLKESICHHSKVQSISFSWPGKCEFLIDKPWHSKRKFVSSVVPWRNYTFRNYNEYLRQYAESSYSLTFKKGGWDCFRHIEIMSSGSVPIMPDISSCPPKTMIFYPKELMKLALKCFSHGYSPPRELVLAFSEWMKMFLTSESMAEYMLGGQKEVKEIMDSSKAMIHFIDPGLNSYPDYLSAQILVGLKNLLGPKIVQEVFPALPLYSDWQGDAEKFHGLGFGYTRLLAPNLRPSSYWSGFQIRNLLNAPKGSVVIVGDVSRNLEIARLISDAEVGHARKIFLWGADQAPTRSERRFLSSLDGTIFCREIY